MLGHKGAVALFLGAAVLLSVLMGAVAANATVCTETGGTAIGATTQVGAVGDLGTWTCSGTQAGYALTLPDGTVYQFEADPDVTGTQMAVLLSDGSFVCTSPGQVHLVQFDSAGARTLAAYTCADGSPNVGGPYPQVLGTVNGDVNIPTPVPISGSVSGTFEMSETAETTMTYGLALLIFLLAIRIMHLLWERNK